MAPTKTLALLAPFLVLGSCYTGVGSRRLPDDDDRLLAEHDRYAREIRIQQAEIAWQNKGPRKIDFPGNGAVILREWQLYGLPGEEYMQVLFTYDNTTKKTIDRARVWVTVRDKSGQAVSRAWLDLLMPWFDFTPGNTYTTTIRVPTRGVHLQPGWYWTVGCSTHEREVFGGSFAKRPEGRKQPVNDKYSVRLPVSSAAPVAQDCKL